MTFQQPKSRMEAERLGLPNYGGLLMGGRPKRGIFGGGGMPTVPNITPEMDGMTANAQPMKKGFDWGKLVGVLGDSLLIAGGASPQYVPRMLQSREQRAQSAAEMQREEAKRFAGLEDYKLKKQIDQKYDTPEATSFERTLDAAGITGERRIQLLRQKAENDAQGAFVAVDVTNPDGSVTRQYMRPNGMGGGQAPAAPVGKLRPIGTATPDSGNIVRKADAAKLKAAYGEGPYRAWLQKFGLQEEQ